MDAERSASGLPVPVSSFVGRRDEVPEVCLLLERHRLVTLTGAGGSGNSVHHDNTSHGSTGQRERARDPRIAVGDGLGRQRDSLDGRCNRGVTGVVADTAAVVTAGALGAMVYFPRRPRGTTAMPSGRR